MYMTESTNPVHSLIFLLASLRSELTFLKKIKQIVSQTNKEIRCYKGQKQFWQHVRRQDVTNMPPFKRRLKEPAVKSGFTQIDRIELHLCAHESLLLRDQTEPMKTRHPLR